MSGFENLPGAEHASLALGEVRAEEVVGTGALSDETALKIVVQDVILAESFVQSKRQTQQWESADQLYRAVVKSTPWPGTDIPMANISMPVIMEAVEKLMPTIHLAFFSDRQPFLLTPMGSTTPEAARAKTHLLMWALKESDFKEEIRCCMKQWLIYGFCAARWGWKTSQKAKSTYSRAASVDGKAGRVTKTKEYKEISHPTFESFELRQILFDSTLRRHDVRKAKWVCAQIMTTGYGLEELRNDPTYKNIPTNEQLATILARHDEPTEDSLAAGKQQTDRDLQALPAVQISSADPLAQTLEILEYETEDHIIAVLQRKIVIRNSENEFDRSTFLSCAFIDVPGSAYGFGVAKLLNGDQKLQVGVANAWLNSLALVLNPAFHLQKGTGPGVQNIKVSPGKIINESGELKPLTVASVTTEALQAIQASENRANRRVGANGGDNVPTQALRTAEGVNSFNQGIVDKLQYSIDVFASHIFIPAIEAFLEVCKNNLQPEDINRILSDADGKAYNGDILEFYNGSCRIDVLSSTKLAARRSAGQLAPMILQLVQAQPFQDALTAQAKKFDFVEFLTEVMDLGGWDTNNLIVDASPDEVSRAMQMTMAKSSGAEQQKLQGQSQLLDQANKNKLQQIDAEGIMRGGLLAVKHVFDESKHDATSAIPESSGA